MSFLQSLAPTTPVNKGLATTSNPLYPELISMMQNKKKSDAAEAKFNYQKAQDLSKWKQESMDLDYNGLTSSQIVSSTNAMNNVMAATGKRSSESGKPSNIDHLANEAIFGVKSTIKQMQATNNEIKTINEGSNPDGDFWYLNEQLSSPALMQMQKESDAEKFKKLNGEEYDASKLSIDTKGLTGNPEFYDHTAVSNDHWNKYEDNTAQVYANIGSGKLERNELIEFKKSSMLETDDNGKFILYNGKPVVKDEVPDEVVNEIRMSNKRYDEDLDYRVEQLEAQGNIKGTDAEGNPVYYNKKDLIRDDYLKSGGAKSEIKNVKSMYQKTTQKTPTEGDTQRQEAGKWATKGYNAFAAGSTQDRRDWLNSMSKNGLEFKLAGDGTTVTTTISKSAFEDPNVMAVLLSGEGNEDVLAKISEGKKLGLNKVDLGTVNISGKGTKGGIMNILSLAGFTDKKTTNAADDAINAARTERGGKPNVSGKQDIKGY